MHKLILESQPPAAPPSRPRPLPQVAPAIGATAYLPALGLSVANLLAFVVGHAVSSIGTPIAMVETLVPGRWTTPWLVAVVAFAASSLFGWSESWSGVTISVVVATAMAVLVARWSRCRGWGAAHLLALAGAALLHQAATGFLLTQLFGREGAVHVIGNVVFAPEAGA
jgi:hypothetical protein